MTQAEKPHIVILGAGPAGLGAAYKLAQRGQFRVTVLEQNPLVGGNAGSFEVSGQRVDFGSHRLHPSCEATVLEDIRTLLGADLLDRPRHGRIRLRGRWIHFPLKPLDLALRLPPAFALGAFVDMARKPFQRSQPGAQDNFASAMQQGLGATICRDFYFPYARKIWGVEPEQLSVTQARRRVKNNSLGKMVQKALSAIPGLKPPGSGRFFYPRRGFGQISEAYAQAAQQAGADLCLGARVQRIEPGAAWEGATVHYEAGGTAYSILADQVWSTIPMAILARLLDPGPPAEMLAAASQMASRAMILIYLVLDQAQFSEYDAHYFPESEIAITRLSEPKNYSGGDGPRGQTVLCAELPCSPQDAVWEMSDAALGDLVCDALARAGLPVQAPVLAAHTRRLRFAYPIYHQGYEVHFDRLDDWLSGVDGLLSFGRQGLFAHDNTHHALFMAYSAVECLGADGGFDQARWQEYRRIFETHVVED